MFLMISVLFCLAGVLLVGLRATARHRRLRRLQERQLMLRAIRNLT